MLSFFRKKREEKNLLQSWQIPVDPSYRRIDNRDAIQYVNADESCFLYFSILYVKGDSLLPANILAKMSISIIRSDKGWDLKGARQGGNEMLVCVFGFTTESDEGYMKELFEKIIYVGK